MRVHRASLGTAVAFGALFVGCVGGSGGGSGPAAPGSCVGDCTGQPAGSAGDKIVDNGNFVAIYEPASRLDSIQQGFITERTFERVADGLNQELRLPHDVYIVSAECGVPNAFWDPERQAIVMCLELLENFAIDVFAGVMPTERAGEAAGSAYVFGLLHELGHGLIDVYELPVLGREEDAADGFAAWRAIQNGQAGVLLWGAEWFFTMREAGISQYADEHGLGPQRGFNLLCWIFGSNPAMYPQLVPEFLPQERAVRCPGEYEKLNTDWDGLLARFRQ